MKNSELNKQNYPICPMGELVRKFKDDPDFEILTKGTRLRVVMKNKDAWGKYKNLMLELGWKEDEL